MRNEGGVTVTFLKNSVAIHADTIQTVTNVDSETVRFQTDMLPGARSAFAWQCSRRQWPGGICRETDLVPGPKPQGRRCDSLAGRKTHLDFRLESMARIRMMGFAGTGVWHENFLGLRLAAGQRGLPRIRGPCYGSYVRVGPGVECVLSRPRVRAEWSQHD